MLHSFSCCGPSVKNKLFSSFCLSLYGSYLWSSSPALRSLELLFNNIIMRKIWRLPRAHMCHTDILHQIVHLNSIQNIVFCRCSNLVLSALKYQSQLVRKVFAASSQLVYTTVGYNSTFKSRHLKLYTEQDRLCATFIRGLIQ